MRGLWIALLSFAPTVLPGMAGAQCPSNMLSGGGPQSTDCFVEFGGISSMDPTCTDGDPTCDTDGKADGTCTLALQVAVNVVGTPGCTPGTLAAPPKVRPVKSDAERKLAAELAALEPAGHGCTPPGFAVPVKVGLSGLKPGVAKFAVSAVSAGKHDRNKLALGCAPGAAPSFANDVQPIFTTKCATSGCHQGFQPAGGQSLEPGMSCSSSVNTPSQNPKALTHGLKRVEPGSLRTSYMARKILGKGLIRGQDDSMPQGCPVTVPCLTPAEHYTILSWIQTGARCDN